MSSVPEQPMVEVVLGRIVIRENSDRQYIFLVERGGVRGFPIVIGSPEAAEIQRVVAGIECERPLTHQLAYSILESLGARHDEGLTDHRRSRRRFISRRAAVIDPTFDEKNV